MSISNIWSWGTSFFWPTSSNSNTNQQNTTLPADEERLLAPEIVVPIEAMTIQEPVATQAEGEEDPILAELELPTGKIKIAKYWLEREDDGDDEDESKKREPIATKHHVGFLTGLLVVCSLNGFFGCKEGGTIFASGTASSTMQLVRTYLRSAKEKPAIRNAVRIAAITALVGSIILQYSLSDQQKGETLFRVINAIPWSYPALGLLRQEITELDLPSKLIQVSEYLKSKGLCKNTISKNAAELTNAALQMVPAFLLANAGFTQPAITAASSVLFKMSLRELTFKIGRDAYEIADPLKRRIVGGCIGAAATAAIVTGYIANYFQLLTNPLGNILNSLFLVGPSDIGQRTIRQTIRQANEEADDAKHAAKLQEYTQAVQSGQVLQKPTLLQRTLKKVKSLGKGILYSLPVLATALTTGQLNDDPTNNATASITAPLLGDAVGIVRMATRRQFPTWALVTAAAIPVLLGGAAFSLKVLGESSLNWPLYGATVALSSMGASMLTNQFSQMARLQKMQRINEKAELKQAKQAARQETTPQL